MSIDTDTIVPKAYGKHQVGRLSTHARKIEEFVHGPGNSASVILQEDPAGFQQVPRLCMIEANRVDQMLDFLGR